MSSNVGKSKRKQNNSKKYSKKYDKNKGSRQSSAKKDFNEGIDNLSDICHKLNLSNGKFLSIFLLFLIL